MADSSASSEDEGPVPPRAGGRPAPLQDTRTIDELSSQSNRAVALDSTTNTSLDKAKRANIPAPHYARQRLRKKDMAESKIEEIYPGLFLEPTRENLVKIMSEQAYNTSYVNYPYKDDDNPPTMNAFVKMKSDLLFDISKHFLTFGTGKCIGYAIKMLFPTLDCSTYTFKDLRRFALETVSNMKHDFLFDKLFTYIYGLTRQFPEETSSVDQKALITFLGARFDANLARLLFGRAIQIVDIDKTFANRNSRPAWYLRQVFVTFAIKSIGLVKSELALNPTMKWGKKAPPGWKADKTQRDDMIKLFDNMCVNESFRKLELDMFAWMTVADDDTPTPLYRQPLPPGRQPTDIAKNMVLEGPPPSPEPSSPRQNTEQGAQPIRSNTPASDVSYSPSMVHQTPPRPVADEDTLSPGISAMGLGSDPNDPNAPTNLQSLSHSEDTITDDAILAQTQASAIQSQSSLTGGPVSCTAPTETSEAETPDVEPPEPPEPPRRTTRSRRQTGVDTGSVKRRKTDMDTGETHPRHYRKTDHRDYRVYYDEADDNEFYETDVTMNKTPDSLEELSLLAAVYRGGYT